MVCKTGIVVDMDVGGYRIIEQFIETRADRLNYIGPPGTSFTTKAERNMFRTDPLKYGISMEQIEIFFGYENVSYRPMTDLERENLIKFRQTSIYCNITNRPRNQSVNIMRRKRDLDLQIQKRIGVKPEHIPKELSDMFIDNLLANQM